jgi:putative ABC transport system ATP-binding protein
MPDLAITDLTIEYSSGGFAIRPIDHLTVDARAGSLVLVLGPSGSGKTSLLSALGGILTPHAGSIRVGDIEVTKLAGKDMTAYRQRTVGIVFQAFNLVPSLTALENVAVPLRAAGVHHREAHDRAGVLLDRVGLHDRMRHRPGDMSGGQQQRVALARALALDPPLILADEPTAHLDYVQVEGVLTMIRELAAGERIVVVSTHDQRLLPLADQVVELVPEFGRSDRPPVRQKLAPGEVLFRQGSWGDTIYTVESGEIEIVGELANGGERLLAVKESGTYFGEVGPLYHMPRSATARARVAAVVVGYSAREFRHLIKDGKGTARRRARKKAPVSSRG